MNIQDEMQKIHHKFGVSEMANYKIEQFIEDLIKKDRAEQLRIAVVVGQSEQLKPMVFELANKLAIAGHGDEAVSMHRIHNRL